MMCDIGNGFDRVPWHVDFNSVNDSSFEETDNVTPDVLSSCTSEEYQRFDSFFSKFMTLAKDFFLPSERHRYGLVSERSLLSTLGIGEFSSWLAVLHFAGCPSCLKIIEKEDDLNDVLHMENPVISEVGLFPLFRFAVCTLYHYVIMYASANHTRLNPQGVRLAQSAWIKPLTIILA